jgi:hypothetical protein
MSLPRAPDGLTFLIALKKLDCYEAILGFPHGSVTPAIGMVIDRLAPISHTKYAGIMTGDLDKEYVEPFKHFRHFMKILFSVMVDLLRKGL